MGIYVSNVKKKNMYTCQRVIHLIVELGDYKYMEACTLLIF